MFDNKENTVIYRYPGVKPFSTSEEFLFFGRQTDIEALHTLIFIKQIVVLYGKSGYGKSSLINAGIIPKLKENDTWNYFSVRFNNFSEKEGGVNVSPSQTFRQKLSDNINPSKKNILDNLIPNENSFWYWIKQNQYQNRKMSYIFFFDQFEELFTYPLEKVQEFSEQLSELLYNTLPVKFKKKIAELDELNIVSDEDHEFLYDKPEIKVVFSIRSDRLSLLNALTSEHPSILQHCYELNALSTEDTKQAIIRPASISTESGFKTPSFSFTDKAIDKITKSVCNQQDGKTEAATLQIVCRYIEVNLVAIKHLHTIDEHNLGEITDIFQQYYQGVLNKLPDTEKLKAQQLIEDELIDGDRRNPLSASYIKTKFGLSENLLLQLEQSSLLRRERDASGRILYEVSHDSLVAAIERVAVARRRVEETLRNIELEKQVIEERNRAEELERLNKKAVFRYKLSLGLVALSLIIATMAVFFRQQSVKAEQEANRQKQVAVSLKKEAEKAKEKVEKAYKNLEKSNALTEVKNLISAAREFETIDENKRACETYRKADIILHKYPEEKDLETQLHNNIQKLCGK
ncbi:MAG TPA: hypothetical protein PK191_06370 [Niabella sp.]|nr:hypothetical protein [Niabella sp.]HOZ95585.1 hypothetical protein [Niabella sp.]HQW13825.1 hypothetical protein [Niabella sp.]HQX19282.1 hypothetical protein [Niabella sp.]HQX41634.1 hypothetical protein [Niabella sp.]